MNAVVDIKKGLEGVVVDSTSISLVDGEAGRLYYRGYPIEKLVTHPFAAVAHLVVFGELPSTAQLTEFEDFLWDAGRLPAGLVSALQQLAALGGHPMATLQAAMPLMAGAAPSRKMGRTADEQEALVVAARLPRPPGAAEDSGAAIAYADAGFLFARSVIVNSIARSIGNRTVPLILSIHA